MKKENTIEEIDDHDNQAGRQAGKVKGKERAADGKKRRRMITCWTADTAFARRGCAAAGVRSR